MAGETQIVLQWPLLISRGEEAKYFEMLGRIGAMEAYLDEQAGDLFSVDGHDLGSGSANIFLYADDSKVAATLEKLKAIIKSGKLAPDARLARAVYEDDTRENWHFEPIYPPGLKRFGVFGEPQDLGDQ